MLRLACIIRIANLIIMWCHTSLIILFLTIALSGFLPTEEELKKSKKEFTIQTTVKGV